MSKQVTASILMIRPVGFRYNEQTAVNNYYQQVLEGITPDTAQEKAAAEFDAFVENLRQHGVDVVVQEDTKVPDTPDAVFPNNWVSFHEDGRVGLYPMYAQNRRLERRKDIVYRLKDEYGFKISDFVDFSKHEEEDKFLEGTGSLVLDRANKIAYAAVSLRTDKEVLDEFCGAFEYKAVAFTANQTVDGERLPIYHTNVMMCVGDQFAVLCADAIDDEAERKNVVDNLEGVGKEIVYITEDQKHHFAGNMLQVATNDGNTCLVMSSAAYQSLTEEQRAQINKYCPIVHASLDTIEALGGGSARCMMAEIFLPK